jgi:hypothetical protein
MLKADKRAIEGMNALIIKRQCRAICAEARTPAVTSVRLEPSPKPKINLRDWKMAARARRERAEREARRSAK